MTHLETTWHDQDPPKGQDPAKSMDVSQVFLSARSAFHAYPGCLYPISVFPGFIRRSRKIFPPPLCGRLVLLDARKAGEGLPMGTQVSNSRLTVVLRSQVLDRRDRLRLLWILTLNRPASPITSTPCVQLSWTRVWNGLHSALPPESPSRNNNTFAPFTLLPYLLGNLLVK